MSAVIPFLRPAATRPGCWSQQELAEFYRVEAALIRAGIGTASEHGLSDEGEPWFVFCRPDGDEIMHFARIDGSYVIASEVLDRPVRGPDFRTMIDQIARRHPELLPIPAAASGTKLVVHPAALLAALVAAAALSLSSEDAHAGELDPDHGGAFPSLASDGAGASHGETPTAKARGTVDPGDQENSRKQLGAIILSAMIFAAEALAADHRDASPEPSLVLSERGSHVPDQMAQADMAQGAGAVSGSGFGAGSASQPAGLTAQGSGASLVSAVPGSRSDAVPVVKTDLSGDRSSTLGSESGHHAPGFGNEAAMSGTTAETGSVKTGGQQEPPVGHADGATASPNGSSAGGEPGGIPSSPSAADPGAQVGPADSGQAGIGSGGTPQVWANPVGHSVATRVTDVSVTKDVEGKDHGVEVRTASGAVAQVEHSGHGHGHGHGAQAQPAAQDDSGLVSHGKENGPEADSSGDSVSTAQTAAIHGNGPEAGGVGPSHHGDPKGPGGHGAHGVDAAAQDKPGGSADARSDASSHAAADPTTASHGQGDPADARSSNGGHGSGGGEAAGPRTAADHASASPNGPPHEKGPPGQSGRDGSQDVGAGHASGPASSFDKSDGGSSPSKAHGGGPASPDGHAGLTGATPDPHRAGPASHGHGPAVADHGPPVQEGSAPAAARDQPGHGTPPASANQDASAGNEHVHPGQASSDHGAGIAFGPSTPATGQDTAIHGSVEGVASGPSGGPGSPGAARSETASQAEPSPAEGGHGSTGAVDHHPAVAGPQNPSGGSASAPSAAVPPPGQVPSAGAAGSDTSHHSAQVQDQPTPPRASVDAGGNLVFHADAHHDPVSPAAASGPGDPAAHHAMGLVGVQDQVHPVHDLYHHA